MSIQTSDIPEIPTTWVLLILFDREVLNHDIINSEVATGVVLKEKVFWEISQNSQENSCARISFLIKS